MKVFGTFVYICLQSLFLPINHEVQFVAALVLTWIVILNNLILKISHTFYFDEYKAVLPRSREIL